MTRGSFIAWRLDIFLPSSGEERRERAKPALGVVQRVVAETFNHPFRAAKLTYSTENA